jgi:hypothetical protein
MPKVGSIQPLPVEPLTLLVRLQRLPLLLLQLETLIRPTA